jgi:Tfp pilus assembly protein PilN
MNAVNLLPRDTSGGGHKAATGLAPYAVLGALALVVAMSALYTLTTRSLTTKRAEVAAVSAQATAAEAAAAKLKRYTEFSTLRKTRVENVKNLADSRFDWATSLHEVARTLPKGTWITSLRASVSPTASVDGTTDQLRTALAVPALELVGCAPNQGTVADVVASLRRTSGAQRVTLSSSKKAATSGNNDNASSSDGCGNVPQFSVTVFYKAQSAATTAAAGATSASPATGSPTTPSSGTAGGATPTAPGTTGGTTGTTTP